MLSEIEQVNQTLEEIGKRHAIHNLSLTRDGTAGLQLKNSIKVFFEYVHASRKLYIYTPLMILPDNNQRRHAVYEMMLSANFLNIGCCAGSLAIFLRTGEAVCQIGMALDTLDADQLEKSINDLIAQQEDALYQLSQLTTAAATEDSSGDSYQSTLHRLSTSPLTDSKKRNVSESRIADKNVRRAERHIDDNERKERI